MCCAASNSDVLVQWGHCRVTVSFACNSAMQMCASIAILSCHDSWLENKFINIRIFLEQLSVTKLNRKAVCFR